MTSINVSILIFFHLGKVKLEGVGLCVKTSTISNGHVRLLKHILFLKSLKVLPKQHKVRYILITHIICILEDLLEKRKYLF